MSLAFRIPTGFETFTVGSVTAVLGDAFAVLSQLADSSIHGIVTDPPYGLKEYEHPELTKKNAGKGGIWRIPPSFDGHERSPLPRFTALNPRERRQLQEFLTELSKLLAVKVLPGAHIFLAANSFLSQLVYTALVEGGLEFRGEIIRLVQTLRGGDRPKNAESEFPDVCSMPRGAYEPWGIFRRPLPEKMTVAECLRQFSTGGIRRLPDGNPFADVVLSERTPAAERDIADHPSLKPQSFMRQVVYAALPLGKGVILDPFMGSGSTLAAATALGLQAVGIERNHDFFEMSRSAIPRLSAVACKGPARGQSRSASASAPFELFATGSA